MEMNSISNAIDALTRLLIIIPTITNKEHVKIELQDAATNKLISLISKL
jgi:hypothetical protein